MPPRCARVEAAVWVSAGTTAARMQCGKVHFIIQQVCLVDNPRGVPGQHRCRTFVGSVLGYNWLACGVTTQQLDSGPAASRGTAPELESVDGTRTLDRFEEGEPVTKWSGNRACSARVQVIPVESGLATAKGIANAGDDFLKSFLDLFHCLAPFTGSGVVGFLMLSADRHFGWILVHLFLVVTRWCTMRSPLMVRFGSKWSIRGDASTKISPYPPVTTTGGSQSSSLLMRVIMPSMRDR